MTTFDARTGSTLPMVALHTKRGLGQKIATWHWGPLANGELFGRIEANRFRYGSFRPSYRAALLIDGATADISEIFDLNTASDPIAAD